MTLREMYDDLGSNYDNVLGRLMNEQLVNKFVLLFKNDGSFTDLKNSMSEKNYKEAFRAVHTLKGVAQNLGFDKLAEAASDFTEFLRGRETEPVGADLEKAEALYKEVEYEYSITVEMIDKLD